MKKRNEIQTLCMSTGKSTIAKLISKLKTHLIWFNELFHWQKTPPKALGVFDTRVSFCC